jgi:two-component system, chemotaxis family, protein-glutamate methylesterase/glutaminase
LKNGHPRVLVCEGSLPRAHALRRLLEHDGLIDVVAVCTTADHALRAVPDLTPDLVMMDAELPASAGLAAIGEIMSTQPVPILLMSDRIGFERHAAAAIGAGALEAFAKDDVELSLPEAPEAVAFRRRVVLLANVPVINHPGARLAPLLGDRRPAESLATVVGICASTGGPHALRDVLSALPASFPLPVLVVQHMTAGFTQSLVRWLDDAVELPVRLAADGTPATAGVWVARDGSHLVLDAHRRLRLDTEAGAGAHCPSGDVLLRSLAAHEGAGAVAVILSGMGSDGAAGLEAVAAAGGATIAQDEATSAIYGMPKAAAERGAKLVLPLDRIGPALARLGEGPR